MAQDFRYWEQNDTASTREIFAIITCASEQKLWVTRAAENSRTNRIIGVICPLLPPRVFAKSRPVRKMVGRGGGDRTKNHSTKSRIPQALQPPFPGAWYEKYKFVQTLRVCLT